MKSRYIRITFIVFPILFLFFTQVMAEDERQTTVRHVFLPVMQREAGGSGIPPTPTPIYVPDGDEEMSKLDCEDRDKDGQPDGFYSLSKTEYPNGTSTTDILKGYWMHPGDWGAANTMNGKYYFPRGKIYVKDSASFVCLPTHYSLMFWYDAQPGDDVGVDFGKNGVPHWSDNLQDPDTSMLAASSELTKTYVFLGLAISGESWFGNTVLGPITRGGEKVGSLIELDTTSFGAAILKKAGWIVGAKAVYDRISKATTEGLAIPATELMKGSIIYYAVPTTQAYFRCFEDAVTVADNLPVPTIRRLYLFNNGTRQGCIISSSPWDSTDKLWNWAVVAYAGIKATTDQKFDKQFVDDLLKSLDDYYLRQDDDPSNDPKPAPIIPKGQECPMIPIAAIREFAINATIAEADARTVQSDRYTQKEILDAVLFAEDARDLLPYVALNDWYREPRYRNSIFVTFYVGGLTNQGLDPDSEGNFWNIETLCQYQFNGTFIWFPNIAIGRLNTGITRDDLIDGDKVDPDYKTPFYGCVWDDFGRCDNKQ